MKIEEFVKAMSILGTAYNKEFTQIQIITWYEYFKLISLECFKKAIKQIIPKNKFMPSIAELLEECRNVSKTNIELILESMQQDNYFKDSRELEKVYTWLDQGIIPSWLKEDMKAYGYKGELGFKNINLIGDKI